MLSQGKQHQASKRARRRAIGIGVIALAMLLVMLAALQPNPFASDRSYWAEFDSVQGLGSIDRDIRVAGANVGKIGKVEQNGDDARVELVISDDNVDLHSDARADLRPHTLFEGSAFIDLTPGSPSAPDLGEGETIPLDRTTVYVSLDQALRILREPVREGVRGFLRIAAKTLQEDAIAGLQRTLQNGPALTHQAAQITRAIQGPHGTELQGAVAGLSHTVDDVAAHEDELIPLARRANVTLAALEVDAAQPLDQALAELPGALEELQAGGVPLARTLDGLRLLAANVRPAIPDLKAALKQAGPFIDRSLPVFRRLRPMLTDFQAVLKRFGDAGPALQDTVNALYPGAKLLAREVLPDLVAESRLGQPAYVQLGSMFTSLTGAVRPYQTIGQNPAGEGHEIRLGAYFDPQGFSGNVPISCAVVAQIDPAAATTLEALGLCQP